MNTVIRLTTFYELNVSDIIVMFCFETYPRLQSIRVVFRFLMVIPLLILGFDGVTPHHHVNESRCVAAFLTSLPAPLTRSILLIICAK